MTDAIRRSSPRLGFYSRDKVWACVVAFAAVVSIPHVNATESEPSIEELELRLRQLERQSAERTAAAAAAAEVARKAAIAKEAAVQVQRQKEIESRRAVCNQSCEAATDVMACRGRFNEWYELTVRAEREFERCTDRRGRDECGNWEDMMHRRGEQADEIEEECENKVQSCVDPCILRAGR